jgi:hypothetical protein
MIGLFKWGERNHPALDTGGLGTATVALPIAHGCGVPAPCVGVIVDRGGRTRRVAAGSRMALAEGERAYCFHPGPYAADLLPFAAAPEIGLRLSFSADCPDPRVAQQRFDLFLASEADGRLELADLAGAIEAAVQRELAQGNLDLPPCTTLDEWNAFRAGFNQLLYTRFGVTVEDCVPVDLGAANDYAAILRARAAAEPVPAAVAVPAVTPALPPDAPEAPGAGAGADARALRRLFLELPCLMCGVRLAVLPPGQELFRQHQALLQRLDQVSLSVNTMPALELAAPNQPLAHDQQARRAQHSRRAVAALDEAWALLARLEGAGDARLPALFDEADRIIANLEHDCAERRIALPESEPV